MEPKCTEPYYTKPVETIEKWGHTQCRWTPLLIEPHMYRALLHQTSRNYWEMRRPSPTNWAQVYRALLHQTSRIYWKTCTYPLQMDTPTDWAQVYRALLHQTSRNYWEMRRPSPTNSAKVYRALLNQTCITYWEMWRPFPTNQGQVYRALLHQTSRTYWEICTYPVQMDPPIEPKCTKPYVTPNQ